MVRMEHRLALIAAIEQVGDMREVEKDAGHQAPKTLMAAIGAAMSSPER